MIAERTLSKGLQLAILDVFLDLPVPFCSVKYHKPVAKGLKLIRAEALHLIFDMLDPAQMLAVPKRRATRKKPA